jgi:TRAP-type mannitol/chloroaromatic compound transport system substrate-binding protein
MIVDSFRKKQHSNCDVGGMHCNCCNKYRKKDKYKLNKLSRKQLKVDDYKEFIIALTHKSREEIIKEIEDERVEKFWEFHWWMEEM